MAVVRKVTPILIVEAIEPSLPFWTERLGFALAVEVPDGERLGFVLLVRDGLEVMYQTVRSLQADDARAAALLRPGGSALYLDVDDIAALEEAMRGVPQVVPRRTTFYGATELFVLEPGGHVIGFAQPAAGEGSA